MTDFPYRNAELHAEGVPIARIAAAIGTPFYCYATAALRRRYQEFAAAFRDHDAIVCYAIKANSNLAVVRTLGQLGAGADVVSEGELRRALAAGIDAGKIVYSGVGKTAVEIAAALDAGILQFNVESTNELRLLSELARRRGTSAPVAIRINPNVDAATHEKITTGTNNTKFGIPWPDAREVYAEAARLPGLDVVGVAVHIGSQLTDLAPLEAAFQVLGEAVQQLRADGHDIRRLDLGGGLGIVYATEMPPAPADYAGMIGRVLGSLDCQLVLEPGRALVGNAGVLVTRVITVKTMADRRVIVVDGAMNDLLRPSLYDAWHGIVPVNQAPADAPHEPADVVGPVCESSDIFARARPLPPVNTDDLLAILSAGAYAAVMASSYNSRLLVPEAMVHASDYAVVRPRPSYEELLAADILPEWLSSSRPTSRGSPDETT